MCIFVSLQLSHKFMYTLIIVIFIFMFYNASRNMIQQLSGLCKMLFCKIALPMLNRQ